MSGFLVSCRPEQLPRVKGQEFGVELKFDWEHEELLRGGRGLDDLFGESGLDPGRVESVHLPPGLGRGSDVEMALTERNRGAITSFVHDQMGVVPEAYLVVHPPKSFDYVSQLELIASVLEISNRDFAVENTSVESDWFFPEQAAFFGFAASRFDRLDGLYLTLDTAHLPQNTGVGVDDAEVDELESRLSGSGFGLPEEFRDELGRRVEGVEQYLPEDVDLESASELPYFPALKTLCMAGSSAREIHLNDPVSDEVPDIGGVDSRPLLRPLLECAGDLGVSVAVEPEELSAEVLERVQALRSVV